MSSQLFPKYDTEDDDDASTTVSDDGSFTTVGPSAAIDPKMLDLSAQLGDSLRPILAARLSSGVVEPTCTTSSLPGSVHDESIVISPDDSISRVGGSSASRVGSSAAPHLARKGRVMLSSLGAHEVARLLNSIDLGRYSSNFLSLPWRGADLETAEERDLEDAGIASSLHRRSLLKQVAAWRVDGVPEHCIRLPPVILEQSFETTASSSGEQVCSVAPLTLSNSSVYGGGSSDPGLSSSLGSAIGSTISSAQPSPRALQVERVEVIAGGSPEGHAEAAALVESGHTANSKADYAEARRCFRAAFELTRKVGPQLSAANMLLRLGEAKAAISEYEALLLRPDLSEAHRCTVHRKVSEAMAMSAALEDLAVAMGGAASEEVAVGGTTKGGEAAPTLLDIIDQAAAMATDESAEVAKHLNAAALSAALDAAKAAGAPSCVLSQAQAALDAINHHAAERARQESKERARKDHEERARRRAEEELTAALPRWFGKPASAKLRAAIEKAKTAKVDAAAIEAAEASLSQVEQEEVETERREAVIHLNAALPSLFRSMPATPAALEALCEAISAARRVGVGADLLTKAEGEAQQLARALEKRPSATDEASATARSSTEQAQLHKRKSEATAAARLQAHARRMAAQKKHAAAAAEEAVRIMEAGLTDTEDLREAIQVARAEADNAKMLAAFHARGAGRAIDVMGDTISCRRPKQGGWALALAVVYALILLVLASSSASASLSHGTTQLPQVPQAQSMGASIPTAVRVRMQGLGRAVLPWLIGRWHQLVAANIRPPPVRRWLSAIKHGLNQAHRRVNLEIAKELEQAAMLRSDWIAARAATECLTDDTTQMFQATAGCSHA